MFECNVCGVGGCLLLFGFLRVVFFFYKKDFT